MDRWCVILACSSAAVAFWLFRPKEASKKEPRRVMVGVGVLATARGKFLVGKRKGSHGSGQWALPGGWLERDEQFTTCAVRELEEETGIQPDDIKAVRVLDLAASNNLEFGTVSVFVHVEVKPERVNKVKICEPDKCEAWKWVTVAKDLPHDAVLFRPLEYLWAEKSSQLHSILTSPS